MQNRQAGILTEQEVKDYINTQYEYLDLTQEQFDRYVKFILKTDRFKSWNSKLKNISSAFDFFESKFNEIYELFLQRGYSQETSLELAKNGVLYSDRRNYTTDFNILRVLDFEEVVIRQNVLLYKRIPEKIHAKKCYFMDINDQENQTITNLLKITDKIFEKKFSVDVTKLLKKYPLTEETKNVWAYLANLKDKDLFSEFQLTRREMAAIYPTSIEEITLLKMIAKLSDTEIIEKYGITRKVLLQKHPLNNDTLKAIKAIHTAKDETVQKLFHQSKKEVLQLRTISTEMIKIANRDIRISRGTPCSREELLQMFKSKKKGTYPNG